MSKKSELTTYKAEPLLNFNRAEINKRLFKILLFLILSGFCISCNLMYSKDFDKIKKNIDLSKIQGIAYQKDDKLYCKIQSCGFSKVITEPFMAMEEIENVSISRLLICQLLRINDSGFNKFKISIIVYKLKNQYDHNIIVYSYLSHVYLGHGTSGIESASKLYFDKKACDLNIAESVLLATLVKAPNRFSPIKNPEIATKRHREYLFYMTKIGLISKDKADRAYVNFWPAYYNFIDYYGKKGERL